MYVYSNCSDRWAASALITDFKILNSKDCFYPISSCSQHLCGNHKREDANDTSVSYHMSIFLSFLLSLSTLYHSFLFYFSLPICMSLGQWVAPTNIQLSTVGGSKVQGKERKCTGPGKSCSLATNLLICSWSWTNHLTSWSLCSPTTAPHWEAAAHKWENTLEGHKKY